MVIYVRVSFPEVGTLCAASPQTPASLGATLSLKKNQRNGTRLRAHVRPFIYFLLAACARPAIIKYFRTETPVRKQRKQTQGRRGHIKAEDPGTSARAGRTATRPAPPTLASPTSTISCTRG